MTRIEVITYFDKLLIIAFGLMSSVFIDKTIKIQ